MKRLLLPLLLLAAVVLSPLYAFTAEDIALLESELAKKEQYDTLKQQRIDSIRHADIDT